MNTTLALLIGIAALAIAPYLLTRRSAARTAAELEIQRQQMELLREAEANINDPELSEDEFYERTKVLADKLDALKQAQHPQ
ncbi:MAG: hypothetical protein AAAB13_14380 [Pseudomonas sp.]